MAEIINLRLARKARARGDAAQQAAANRALFGQSKSARSRQQAEADRLARTVDGAKRTNDGISSDA